MPNPRRREASVVEIPILDRQLVSLETARDEIQKLHHSVGPLVEASEYPEIGSKRLAWELSHLMEDTSTAYYKIALMLRENSKVTLQGAFPEILNGQELKSRVLTGVVYKTDSDLHYVSVSLHGDITASLFNPHQLPQPEYLRILGNPRRKMVYVRQS